MTILFDWDKQFRRLSLLPVSAESAEPQPRLGFTLAREHELQIGLFLLPEEGLLSLGGGDKAVEGGEELADAVLFR